MTFTIQYTVTVVSGWCEVLLVVYVGVSNNIVLLFRSVAGIRGQEMLSKETNFENNLSGWPGLGLGNVSSIV